MEYKKKGQKRCKPGYVARGRRSVPGCLSFIQAVCHHTARAAYPPAMDGPSLTAGIFGLATRRMCGLRRRRRSRWALTPPFHPYLAGENLPSGGRFLSHYPRSRLRLSVRKCGALRCPDFPLHAPGVKRQTALLPLDVIVLSLLTLRRESPRFRMLTPRRKMRLPPRGRGDGAPRGGS